LSETVGPAVLDDARTLEKVRPLAGDTALQAKFAAVKRANKVALAELIRARLDIHVDPSALFDVQIKRMHEYKRQLLNILETIALYDNIRAQPEKPWVPRVKIFAGKAAGSYHQAKLIIKLINDVARVVNSDPTVRDLLKIVFLPNYNVSLAEVIIPAADLSEQISTAGMEASGTGNMKFALNGALTIGTMDGANIEISEHVGLENIFIFGMDAAQVEARRKEGIDMAETIAASPELSQVLDAMDLGVFSPGEPDRFAAITNAVRRHDWFMVAGDFESYYGRQRDVASLWRDQPAWWRASLLNTANMGWFSSDRTIREYATELWGVPA
jgi:starch phosphorylase